MVPRQQRDWKRDRSGELLPWGDWILFEDVRAGGSRNEVVVVHIDDAISVARRSGRSAAPLDWDEARVDHAWFDLADIPGRPLGDINAPIAERAADAWETANGWQLEPGYATQRLRRLGDPGLLQDPTSTSTDNATTSLRSGGHRARRTLRVAVTALRGRDGGGGRRARRRRRTRRSGSR